MASDILQDATTRHARLVTLSGLKSLAMTHWGDDHARAADVVCKSYDGVGKIVRYGLLPAEFVIDSWGQEIRETWSILHEFVNQNRLSTASPGYARDYEVLATTALSHAGADHLR